MPSNGPDVKSVMYSSHCRGLVLFQITLFDAKRWPLREGCDVQLTLQRLDAIEVYAAAASASKFPQGLHCVVCS